jgi:hypothetical protein
MSEKVIIDETVTPAEEETAEGEFIFSSSHDYIASAIQALSAVDEMDTALMTKIDENRVRKIKRQSLRILSHYINEIYEETFDDNADD